MLSLDVKGIMEIIPHRYPFLFIEKVEELEPGKRAIGYKNVSINEQVFQGHFPGEPILPGVIQIEACAQVGAVVILSLDSFKGKTAYFGGINKVKFKKKIVPGDVMRIECVITDMRGPIGRGDGTVTVNGELAMSCELIFVIGAAGQ
jgi:3-hydroxyacyl-[acyl-carrier-protein] dehydratase